VGTGISSKQGSNAKNVKLLSPLSPLQIQLMMNALHKITVHCFIMLMRTKNSAFIAWDLCPIITPVALKILLFAMKKHLGIKLLNIAKIAFNLIIWQALIIQFAGQIQGLAELEVLKKIVNVSHAG